MKALLVLLALAMMLTGGTEWLRQADPFRGQLAAYTTEIEGRTPAQRRNIAEAARILDGNVVEPGDVFSFNAAVGPRTEGRGYVPAPAFLEREVVQSIGGGICQVASTLYGAILRAGLPITARVPHDRLVRSVPAGSDATVWYGKADLAFRNDRKGPVRLRARVRADRLVVAVEGRPLGPPVVVERETLPPPDRDRVRVRMWRLAGGARELLSDDVYRK